MRVNEEFIHIGERSSISEWCHMTAHEDAHITIGGDVLIGPFTVLNSGSHRHSSLHPINQQGHETAPITIGDDVWLGANVSVLFGSCIPDGCVIGAGGVVTRNFVLQRYGVYVGNPLRKIGQR